MFTRQILQRARACVNVRVAPASLTSLRSSTVPRLAASGRLAVAATSINRQFIVRYYSGEAVATSNARPSSNGLITRFADLASLNVHENILKAITDDMGYEEMTEVQAMSVNPALQGRDM